MSKNNAKEISEGLKKQKQLIKEIINPFFKDNGFSRKGVLYTKKLNYFIIEVEIQRRRYYKENGIENFRININAYSENSYKLFGKSITFCEYSIKGENSWITTDENTNIDELALWLKIELDKLPALIEKYNDIDKIISEEKKKPNREGILYAFLLKDNYKTEEFELWLENTNKKIKGLNNKISELNQKLALTEKENKRNKVEYEKLWSERKSKEIQIEFLERFLREISVLK